MTTSLARRAVGMALALGAACGGDAAPSVRVTVPVGANMRTAAESLASAGVIG